MFWQNIRLNRGNTPCLGSFQFHVLITVIFRMVSFKTFFDHLRHPELMYCKENLFNLARLNRRVTIMPGDVTLTLHSIEYVNSRAIFVEQLYYYA